MIALALVDVGVVLTDVDTLVSCTPPVFTTTFRLQLIIHTCKLALATFLYS